jgi:NAD(P)H-flavin reductase
MNIFSVKLVEKTSLNQDVFELKFNKPEDFKYEAGQFVQFLIPDGDKKSPRSYSISSLPKENYIEFCVKIIPNGLASTYFKNMKIGDELELKGPLGRFVSNESKNNTCLVATGVGLAPIYGVIMNELKIKKNPSRIHLHFGVRSEKDIFWLERLERLDRDFDNFSYTLTLSRPTDTWDSHKGRVTEYAKDEKVDQDFFLCGSAEMVKEVRQILIDKKADPKRIHFEIF